MASFTAMKRMVVVLDLVVQGGENDIAVEWVELHHHLNYGSTVSIWRD